VNSPINETCGEDGRGVRTRIDDHLLVAGLGALVGLVPVGVYWITFNDSDFSGLPWKIALAILIASSTIGCVHYLLNRHARRLFWEGIVASIVVVSLLWLPFGSWCFFYFAFAPMPSWIRHVGLTFCITVTAWWIWLSWRNYWSATIQLDLVKRLYLERGDRIIYPGEASDAITSDLEGPGHSIVIPTWVVTTLGPLGGAYAIWSGHAGNASGGPHVLLIMFSVIALPATCWLSGKLLVRTIYFHVYLPFQLERKTGKKVILGP
jgi:hypothetical protein